MAQAGRLSFPRAHARSQRFTLGRPRSFTIAPDGSRVLFLRSSAGDDPVHDLWMLELDGGRESCLVDVRAGATDGADLPAAERARRERMREGAGGIVAYATDRDVSVATFALNGQVHRVQVPAGGTEVVAADGPAYDVRPSPDGAHLAAVVDGALHVTRNGRFTELVAEDGVAWGVADFVAAEEMRRMRGYWWSPDGRQLLVCRVDESDVTALTIADPANPDQPGRQHRYPLAGSTNPDVSLWLVDATTGERRQVAWDREAFPYLAAVAWHRDRPALLHVQSRNQRRAQVLVVDGVATEPVLDHADDAWIDLVPGAPRWAGDRLALVRDVAELDSRALVVGGEPVTPAGMQVRELLRVDEETAWLLASIDDPTQAHLVRIGMGEGDVDVVTAGASGVHGAVVTDDVQVVTTSSLDAAPATSVTTATGRLSVAGESLDPGLVPAVEMLSLGGRGLRAALLRPARDGPWPVLLDPYGGPHVQRVLASRQVFLTPAWFAAQGFAVLVADGRGSPGRGPAWEREVLGDLAGPPLQDQVDALAAAAEVEPRLDLDRVGIRGWSFGGYLAALACLRRPDVFRAGIVGAPVTQWELYDTHYTERYLGMPDADAANYRRSNVVDADGRLVAADEVAAGTDPAELLVIHGLADDNVVAAHSLRLSAALLAAGHPHAFLPLSGVTHMTPQEVVAENLLLRQRDFLRRTLGTE